MTRLKQFSLPLFLMMALVASPIFTGCSDDDPDTTGTTDVEITSPRTGSAYNYNEYSVDASGNKVPGSEIAVTTTVSANGVSIGGKSDVVKFKSVSIEDEDSTYIKYESNDDVSLYLGVDDYPEIDQEWVVLPFSSKTTQNYTLSDSIDNGSGTMVPVTVAVETSYLREEKVTLQNEELTVWVAQVKVTGTLPSPVGGTVTIDATSEIYFAPTIGYWYKEDNRLAFGTLITGRTVLDLQSYTLVN